MRMHFHHSSCVSHRSHAFLVLPHPAISQCIWSRKDLNCGLSFPEQPFCAYVWRRLLMPPPVGLARPLHRAYPPHWSGCLPVWLCQFITESVSRPAVRQIQVREHRGHRSLGFHIPFSNNRIPKPQALQFVFHWHGGPHSIYVTAHLESFHGTTSLRL